MTELKAAWQEGTPSRARYTWLVFLTVFLLELVGKNQDLPSLRITHYLRTYGDTVADFSHTLGYYVGLMSDFMYHLQRLQDFIMEILRPFLRAITETLLEIYYAVWDVVGSVAREYFTGYSSALFSYEDAFPLAFFTTHIVAICSTCAITLACAAVLEGIGAKQNLSCLRPSYYIIKVANYIYGTMYDLVVVYSGIAAALTRLKCITDYLLPKIMPFLLPHLATFREATVYIVNACRSVLVAPCVAIKNGFQYVVQKAQRDPLEVGAVASVLVCVTGYLVYANY